MSVLGRVVNGVVVLEPGHCVPDGTEVIVVPRAEASGKPEAPAKRVRVSLPLVKSDKPGSVNLTAERIAEILEEEDAP